MEDNKNRTYYVYYHIDPRTKWPVYVGKGTKDRAYQFYNRSKNHRKWVADLKQAGLEPVVFIGNIFKSEDKAYKAEEMDISVFRHYDVKLFNIAKGGRAMDHTVCHKPITCLTNNKTYISSVSAAEDLGMLAKRICDVLKGRKKSYRGHTFKYVDEALNVVPQQIRQAKERARKLGSRSKPIMCVETNKEYISGGQAARELGVDADRIYAQLDGRSRNVDGFTFRRL